MTDIYRHAETVCPQCGTRLVVLVALGTVAGAPAAQVWHVLDHPYGYLQGLGGWVALRDLAPCYWPEEEDAP